MNIISGKYKHRKLQGFEIDGTRPTKSVVRESLIAILGDKLDGASVLDLFAGSGAVGLEMLSNGAKKLVLNDLNAYHVLKINIENFNEEIDIYRDEAIVCLKKLKKQNMKFDIIFLDPPYFYQGYTKLLRYIEDNQLLNETGFLIIELEKSEICPKTEFEFIKEKKYGLAKLVFFQAK